MKKIIETALKYLGWNEVDPDHNFRYFVNLYNNYFPEPERKDKRGRKLPRNIYFYNLSWHWCVLFQSAMLIKQFKDLGYEAVPAEVPLEIGTWEFYNMCPTKLPADATPESGDFIFFDWTCQRSGWSHIGLVEGVHDGVIHTIEGNAGGERVVRSSYQINDPRIRAFGRCPLPECEAPYDPWTGIVKTTLTVRETPGKDGRAVGYLQTGTLVNVSAEQDVNGTPWYRHEKGWSSGKYIDRLNESEQASQNEQNSPANPVNPSDDKEPECSVGIVKTGLYMRDAACVKGKILCVLKKDEKIYILEELDNGWLRVNARGLVGYCSGKYVER